MLLLIGVSASPAAAISFDKTTDTAFTVDSDAHWFNNPYKAEVHNGYQYWGYWDAEEAGDVYLVIARRRLSDDNLATIRFDGTGGTTAYSLAAPEDGHNYVGLGLSPNDGRLHISWSLHTSDRRHRYLISNEGCMSQTQANFNASNCTFTFRLAAQTSDRTHEERLTYPTYIRDNENRLYFTYRMDASSHGSQFLNCYNDNGTWEALGILIHGSRVDGAPGEYTFDPDGEGPESEITTFERGTYVSGFTFDKNERMHVQWHWRDGGYNHGIEYAYSDDWGSTWNGLAGTRIATSGSDPIRISDLAEIEVVAVPPGRYAGGTLKVDSDNNPHIFGAKSDLWTAEPSDAHIRPTHYWSDSSGTWYSEYVGGAELGSNRLMGGSLIFDRGNNLYALFGNDDLGWAVWEPGLLTRSLTAQSGRYMDVQLHSSETALLTQDFVNLPISTRGTNQLRVRMRNNTAGRDIRLFWTTDESRAFAIGRGQTFRNAVNARDANYTEYIFTITDADWAGTLRDLEFHPIDGVESGSVSVDWIKLTDSSGRAVKTWDLNRGMRVAYAEASSRDNWSSWEVDTELLEGVEMQREDGNWTISESRYAADQVVDFTAVEQGAPGSEALVVREFDILGDDVIKDWRYDTDAVNWTSGTGVTGFAWTNDGGVKGVSGTINGTDPRIESAANLAVPIETNRYMHIRMKNSSEARRAEMFFQTDAARSYTAEKGVSFSITPNSGYTSYSIDMSGASRWTNETLYKLRLDPVDESARSRGRFYVDRIYINNTR